MNLVTPPPEKPEEQAPEATHDNVRHVAFGQQSAVTDRIYQCRHHSYKLDREQRTASCGACGAGLDLFQILLDYAHGERLWRHWDSERRRKADELAELKAEERKTKARLKNASRKEADAAVAAERVRTERERTEISDAARDITQLCRRIERLAQRRRTLESVR